jgi:hypothetical protein
MLSRRRTPAAGTSAAQEYGDTFGQRSALKRGREFDASSGGSNKRKRGQRKSAAGAAAADSPLPGPEHPQDEEEEDIGFTLIRPAAAYTPDAAAIPASTQLFSA